MHGKMYMNSYSVDEGSQSSRSWYCILGNWMYFSFFKYSSVLTRDVLIQSCDRKSGPITWFQTRSELDVTPRSDRDRIYKYMYIYCHYYLSDLWYLKTNGKNVCAQGTGQVLVNIMTTHRCQHFLCLWLMSSCHSTRSPFIGHDGISFEAELHPRACNHGGRSSDVSVCQHKKKKDMNFVGLISQANGEFKFHAVNRKLSWNQLLLSLLLFV